MINQKILDELRKLNNDERLSIIGATLEMIRNDLQTSRKTRKLNERKQKLTEAANMLLEDYISDKELTAFKSLDSEDFHV